MSSTTYTLSVQFDDQQSQQLNQAGFIFRVSIDRGTDRPLGKLSVVHLAVRQQ